MHPAALRASTEALRETTKWILAVFAALASVLVAGLSFGDAGRLEPWTARFYLAFGGTAVALVAVGCILWQAANVLSGRYDTLRQILTTLQEAETKKPTLRASLTDPLIAAIEEEQQYIYQGAARDLRDLFTQLGDSHEYLLRARASGLSDDPELRTQQARSIVLGETANRVVDYAEHWVTRRRFQHLIWLMLSGGTCVAMGVVLFVMGVSEPERVPVSTQPIPVRIFFTEAGKSWMETRAHCQPSVLDGVAVGGDLTEPDVVIPETKIGPGLICAATRLTVTKAIGVAVPAGSATP